MTTITCRQLVNAPLGSSARLVSDFFDAHRLDDGQAYLSLHAGDLAREARVSLEPRTVRGQMTPQFAVTWKDDLVGPYPGSHGRHGIGRWLLGSVAEAVVCDADRPVLVVRGA